MPEKPTLDAGRLNRRISARTTAMQIAAPNVFGVGITISGCTQKASTTPRPTGTGQTRRQISGIDSRMVDSRMTVAPGRMWGARSSLADSM